MQLTTTLVGAVLASLALAFWVHDGALRDGLRGNAASRLAGAARAADQLIADHLLQLESRYRTAAATPQLRATLELNHPPTTESLASRLRAQQRAEAIELYDERGEPIGRSGPLLQEVEAALPGTSRVVVDGEGRLIAQIRVAIETSPGRRYALVASEVLGAELLGRWSALCGAQLTVSRAIAPDEPLAVPVGERAGVWVSSDLAPEQKAMRIARSQLAVACLLALLAASAASAALARRLTAPLRRIRGVIERIGRGDLSVRLDSRRRDEIGAMARGVDRMADQLLASGREIAERLSDLRKSQAHLNRAQHIARVGSFELDLDRRELVGSDEFWRLLGLNREKGADPRELLRMVAADERESVADAIKGCIADASSAVLEFRVATREGERFLQAQLHLACDEPGGSRRLEGMIQDITERRRTEEQIRYLAYHDSLTGLGNRALFRERASLAIARARRRRAKLALLYLDLDDFKRVNDTLGHDVGDDLLREVADRLTAAVSEAQLDERESPRPGEPLVSRLGGDEFAILVEDVLDPGDLAWIADHLLTRLQRPYPIANSEVVISGSIGIAIWPMDGPRFENLLANADAAMYHAKEDGRSSARFFDASMNEAAHRRLRLEVRLRSAIANGELELLFQPKLELSSDRIVGFEALARWDDRELGVVSPVDFVSVAEETGLIAPLGRWVVAQLCRDVAEWTPRLREAGAAISFNVSARELGPSFARELAAQIAETGVDPSLLQVEITETAILRDERSAASVLEEIRDLGISIALDDFGTGFSSLAYLQRLPVDTLKMDGSFIQEITEDPSAATLARSIVAMGTALGLCVVAEGVELEAQRDLLKRWGCHVIQGYLVGKPLPASRAFAALTAAPAESRSRSTRRRNS
jgi:diguanylate cyclase (GGDEF)-like protein/PAS domain S-box-containing protein